MGVCVEAPQGARQGGKLREDHMSAVKVANFSQQGSTHASAIMCSGTPAFSAVSRNDIK